jgi:ubiquinone/menaquinone biosynthesis C-methylase UbiE
VEGVDPHGAIYNGWAADFDALNAEMPEPLIVLGEQLLRSLPARPRILDVGCGPGRDMAWFEARGASMTGIDISSEMLARAATKTRGRLVEMDMRSISSADASFDAVWAIASLLHIPKAEAAGVLGEFRRVVAPEGLVAISVKHGSGEGWESPALGPERFFAYYELEELVALLAEADLAVESLCVAAGRGCEWLNLIARPAT